MTRTCFKLAALFVLLIIAMPIWAQGDLKGQMDNVKGTVNLVRNQAPPVLRIRPGKSILLLSA